MMLPRDQDITELYHRYHTPASVQDHMQMVENIAVVLAKQRQEQGDQVNFALLKAAALLHDLVRLSEQRLLLPATINPTLSHAEINYLLLRDRFPEVADTVRTHSLMTILTPQSFTTLEQKLLYYADKRVDRSSVVSLEHRLKLGQERWQVSPEQDHSAELVTKLTQLEQELFSNLTIQPSKLHASNV